MDIDLLRKDECQPLTSEQMTDIKSQFHPSNTANVNMKPYHVYSTDEQIVGTWIDGSYVYEKVISNLDKNIQYNTWTEVAPAPTNANMLINADAIGKDSSNNPVFLSGSGYEMYINNGNIYAEYNQNVNVRKFTAIIIRYTKTTD